jgi:dCTP deaminase
MSAGILSGLQIVKEVEAGNIKISPFDKTRANPASYDLTLGSEVAIYEDVTRLIGEGQYGPVHVAEDKVRNVLDAAKQNYVKRYEMKEDGFLLVPGIGYLMHTEERIRTEKFVPIVDGKSSIGRLFCFVHVTAGYGDPGFDGQYTLEVVVVHPLIVYPGMRFCQIRFHTLVGDVETYQNKGNYVGVDHASGPVPSRSWKMFDERK